MKAPADRAGVSAHFKQVLEQLPDLQIAFCEGWNTRGLAERVAELVAEAATRPR